VNSEWMLTAAVVLLTAGHVLGLALLAWMALKR